MNNSSLYIGDWLELYKYSALINNTALNTVGQIVEITQIIIMNCFDSDLRRNYNLNRTYVKKY